MTTLRASQIDLLQRLERRGGEALPRELRSITRSEFAVAVSLDRLHDSKHVVRRLDGPAWASAYVYSLTDKGRSELSGGEKR
jgi:hypothetical protein